MPVTAGEVLQVALDMPMPEQVNAFNVLRFLCESGSATDAEILTAIGSWITAAYTSLLTAMSDQVDVSNGRVAKIAWSGTEWITNQIVGTILPGLTGTRTEDMLPHAVAACITFPTDKPQSRGRVFLPGFTENLQDNSLWIASAATTMGNFATLLRTAIYAGSATLRYAIAGNDGVARVTSGFSVNGITGSQRRRKPGVGI